MVLPARESARRADPRPSMAAREGRDMDSLSVTVFRGTPEKEALEQYAEHGVNRVLLGVPPVPRDEALALLDDYAKLI